MSSPKLPIKTAAIGGLVLLFFTSAVCACIAYIAKGFMVETQYTAFIQQIILVPPGLCIVAIALFLLYWWYQTIGWHRPTSTPPLPPSESTTKKQALVVDDTPANRLIISKLLQDEGILVTQAEHGEQALALFECDTFDAVFMDIEMEGINGLIAVQKIREKEQAQQAARTPIIAVSAHSEQEKKLQALATGFDDYIVKPVNNQRIGHALHRWCGIEANHTTHNQSDVPQTHTISNTPLTASTTEAEVITKVIDIEQSLEYSHGNRELAKEMLKLLISMINQEKEALIHYHREQDWESLSTLTHKLHGGSCYCGVPQLQQCCETADKMLQNYQYENIDNAINALLIAMNDILIWDSQYDIEIIFES